MRSSTLHRSLYTLMLLVTLSFTIFLSSTAFSFDMFDLISGIIESPQFKGKDPITKLRLAAEMLKNKQVKQSDLSFALLDWGDQYLRELSDPLDRLKRWSTLTSDEQLSHLRIPRDFLNRMLLTEYLVDQPTYRAATPRQRLEIISKLAEKNLVDWSVSLAYARLYAGALIVGATRYEMVPPLEALITLKKLKDEGLVGWHYRVPTEAILASEVLAMDKGYRNASPYDQLARLKELESKGLITMLTKKEFEKLPAWRLLISDPSFVKADISGKKDRLNKLKTEGMISPSTCSDLTGIFRPVPLAAPVENRPAPLPQKIGPPPKQN